MNIAGESVSEWFSGSGTANESPTALGQQSLLKGVTIKAVSSNLAPIVVSRTPGAPGFLLHPGAEIEIKADSLAKVFASASGEQSYSWMGA